MNSIQYVTAEANVGYTEIKFGSGEFEILTLDLSSKSATHIGFGSVSWLTTESDGTSKTISLLSGWFSSTRPYCMTGTKIVQGPAKIYVLADLPSGAYVRVRMSYRKVK